MRRLTLILLAALAFPAAALAVAGDKGDGTLAVRSATGKVQISARGSIFGRIDSGKLTIFDANPDDSIDPQIFGTDRCHVSLDDRTTVCSDSTGFRFRFLGGRYRVTLVGSGINVSAVGKGTATLTGRGTADDGDYSVNGGAYTSLSVLGATTTLAATPAP